MKDYIIHQLEKEYVLTKRDMGDLALIRKGMFRFENEAWRVENIGSFFYMKMSGMLGLMKMEAAVIVPEYRDLDFCNADTVSAMGNHTLMLEMYSSHICETDFSAFEELKKKYCSLADYETEPRWYDEIRLSSSIRKAGKKCVHAHEMLMKEYIDTYLDLLRKAPSCDYEQKRKANALYAEHLLKEGGAAVDSMNKMIGREKTDRLVAEYMFDIR